MFNRFKKNEKNEKQLHKVYIELDTHQKVADFTNACNTVPEKIVLRGVDENGEEWYSNAKSLLLNLAIAGAINDKKRVEEAKNVGRVNWNTVYVESEADIYNVIKDFAK